MNDLRFLQELGAELDRVGQTHGSPQHPDRGRRRPTRASRSALTGIGLALSVLVVVAVAALGLRAHTPGRADVPGRAGREVRIVFRVAALHAREPLGPAIQRTVGILRRRLGAVLHSVRVSRTAGGLVVVVPAGRAVRARILALAAPARLEFYDWEANALTANGKTVASRLPGDPAALQISQGTGSAAPGEPGAGSLPLYAAVQLASQQSPAPDTAALARPGREYYLFGAPNSAACAAAAKDQHGIPTLGAHCMLLSAPVDETTTDRQLIAHDIAASLLPGIKASQGRPLVVPPGTVVLQAAAPRAGQPTSVSSPPAQFYVLKDNMHLSGDDVTPTAVDRPIRRSRCPVRLQLARHAGVPPAHWPDRASRGACQRIWADARSAFRRGTRPQADHGRLGRFQDLPRWPPGRRQGRHHRGFHGSDGPGARRGRRGRTARVSEPRG